MACPGPKKRSGLKTVVPEGLRVLQATSGIPPPPEGKHQVGEDHFPNRAEHPPQPTRKLRGAGHVTRQAAANAYRTLLTSHPVGPE